MFELPINQKSVSHNAPDESEAIKHLREKFSISSISGFHVSGLRSAVKGKLRWMLEDYDYGSEPELLFFRDNNQIGSTLENRRNFRKPPLYLLGIFLEASIAPSIEDQPIRQAITFTALSNEIRERDEVLEQGFTPIKKTRNFMRETPSAFFVTAKRFIELPEPKQKEVMTYER